MEDGKVEINTQIDESGVEKGLKGINKKLSDFAKKMKTGDVANLGASITGLVSGVGTAFKLASTGVKAMTKAVKETTEAYKTQIKAETQLDVAVRNSPYMNGESAKAFKDLASSIQKVSTYGDEQLLPFFAKLVNAGRSEAETMDIMQTAVNIASSGMMDLGSAVSSLNMTYQGTAGTLGRQITSVKNLTAEELKSGKAVEILKKQFDGVAEEVAKATGSSEQLQNSLGDLKEEIGAGWEKPLSKVRGWLVGIIDKTVEAKKEIRLLREAEENIDSGNAGINDYTVKIENLNKELEKYRSSLNELKTKAGGNVTEEDKFTFGSDKNAIAYYRDELERTKSKIAELKAELEGYQNTVKDIKKAEEDATNELKKKAEEEKAEKEIQDALNKSTENYQKIIEKKNQAIQNAKNQAKALGEEVDQQTILNAELTAYLEMAQDPNLPSMTQKQLEVVQDLVKAQKELNTEEEKKDKLMTALESIDVSTDLKKSDILKEQLQTLDELNEAFMLSAVYEKQSDEEKLRIAEDYKNKRIQLEKDITEAQKEEAEKQFTTVKEIITTVNDYVTQINNTLSQMTKLAQENAEDETNLKMAQLEKQYKEGIVSEDEYLKKKETIEKEAAKKQYELQMWEWSASLIQIASNTAQAISNALATKPAILGIALASTMGALGSVQLASAIKNKPIPPSFASGGIVGGGAYSTGDNIRANIKTGEMILNGQQQLNLWRMAQGGRGGNANNIQIKNYRGNDTSVQPQVTEDGIKILIRKTVADDLQNRRLNPSLLMAENTMNGIKYE